MSLAPGVQPSPPCSAPILPPHHPYYPPFPRQISYLSCVRSFTPPPPLQDLPQRCPSWRTPNDTATLPTPWSALEPKSLTPRPPRCGLQTWATEFCAPLPTRYPPRTSYHDGLPGPLSSTSLLSHPLERPRTGVPHLQTPRSGLQYNILKVLCVLYRLGLYSDTHILPHFPPTLQYPSFFLPSYTTPPSLTTHYILHSG